MLRTDKLHKQCLRQYFSEIEKDTLIEILIEQIVYINEQANKKDFMQIILKLLNKTPIGDTRLFQKLVNIALKANIQKLFKV